MIARPAGILASTARIIPMALKPTLLPTGASGRRKLASWIDGFIQSTASLESPTIYRKWAAISTIAGALEQKVYLTTDKGTLYPNLYTFLIGYAGVGKTNAISAALRYLRELPTFYMGATSMTMASLVDHLTEAKKDYAIIEEG